MSITDGITFSNIKGPYQNNGASPWYGLLDIGTPPQQMKINIDSGTNITWVTSTLCPPESCNHFGGDRFDYEASSSFAFSDCLQRPFSFGPWGTMQIESGSDLINIPSDPVQKVPARMFFSADYSGPQFEQLNWDGGIGLPSSSAYVEGRSSFLFQDLMISNIIDRALPYVSMDFDISLKTGTCQMGGYDEAKTTGGGLFLPWSLYSEYAGVEYLWSSELLRMTVGSTIVLPSKPSESMLFALDSGASEFKGDDKIMSSTLALIQDFGNPQIELTFEQGSIRIDSSIYNVLIEAGPEQGQTLPAFRPLGLNQLALVGSVILDYVYSVFQYEVVECDATTVSLAPVGVYLFNKPGYPQIITGSAQLPGRVKPSQGRTALLPRRSAKMGGVS